MSKLLFVGCLLLATALSELAIAQSCPAPRTDWRCGVNFGRAPCLPNNCCSQYGWCGNTTEHCGVGTQDMSCTPSSGSSPSVSPTPAPTLAPSTAAPTLTPNTAAPTLTPSACPAVRSDWRCGKNFTNAPCDTGLCCSEYGWCGSSSDHCNAKSQIITCSGTPSPTLASTSPTTAPSPAPSSTSAPTTACPAVRSDSRCGKDFGGAPCLSGYCCSEYGWCGTTSQYCNANSQITCSGTPAPTTSSGSASGYIATEYCGNNMIALTFDDGPNFATEAVLNVLQAKQVTGTLFVNGDNHPFDGPTKCSLLQRAVRMGIEIESHSHKHLSFPSLSDQAMFQDLETLEAFLKSCGITTPVKFFRPPFGALTKEQGVKITQQLGYIISFWNSQTEDGQVVNAEEAINILRATMPSPSSGKGALVLLHDAAVRTSLSEVIDWLKQTYPGYRFVTQQECHDACTSWVTTSSGKICDDPDETHYQLWTWL